MSKPSLEDASEGSVREAKAEVQDENAELSDEQVETQHRPETPGSEFAARMFKRLMRALYSREFFGSAFSEIRNRRFAIGVCEPLSTTGGIKRRDKARGVVLKHLPNSLGAGHAHPRALIGTTLARGGFPQ